MITNKYPLMGSKLSMTIDNLSMVITSKIMVSGTNFIFDFDFGLDISFGFFL
ncbi:MAG: hypothetical protein WCR54_03705 [Clostridia bacterium]